MDNIDTIILQDSRRNNKRFEAVFINKNGDIMNGNLNMSSDKYINVYL